MVHVRARIRYLAAAAGGAESADVVIAVVGITSKLEGEEMKVDVPGFKGGDRTSLNLPEEEEALLEALKGSGKAAGCGADERQRAVGQLGQRHANAILDAWYSGEEGGTAIAETLGGREQSCGTAAGYVLQRHRAVARLSKTTR